MTSYFKDDLILEHCRNKIVLHIGATDAPFHIDKAEYNELLHQKLKKICKELIGLDLDEKAVSVLRKYGIKDIEIQDITKPFKHDLVKNYDVIIMGDTIEHLSNPGIALDNIKSIMNKNTKLIITTPNCYCYDNLANIFRSKEQVHQDHMFWPSKQTMRQLFGRYNFNIERFEYVNFGSYKDIKTAKGRLFYNLVLGNIPKIRSTLFFVLKR